MLNEEVEHISQEAFKFIKRYDVVLNNQNKKVINIVGKQGQLLKQFKEAEGFTKDVIFEIFTCLS